MQRLVIDAFRAGDWMMALLRLGSGAHYHADSTQIHHGDPNHDGKANQPTAEGVHAAYETGQLDREAKNLDQRAKYDKVTYVWTNVDPLRQLVMEKAMSRAGKLAYLPTGNVITEVLQQIARGFPDLDPINQAYAEARKTTGAPNAKARDLFMKTVLPSSAYGPGKTVLDVALERVADAAIFTARLWLSAFQESGARIPAILVPMPFSAEAALHTYPTDDFIPHDEAGRRHRSVKKAATKAEEDRAHAEELARQAKPEAWWHNACVALMKALGLDP
jgi:hypothetical protein